MEILDLDAAKRHLRVTHDAWDDDIQQKLDLAHGQVADYITRSDDAWAAEIESWDEDTAPPGVIAAVLAQFGELWRFRGDHLEGDMPKREHGYLSPQVHSYLRRARDPAVR
jgi:hypothetical protein